MTKNSHDDDTFAGLDPREAEELASMVGLMESDRFEPSDRDFWSRLQQSIVNEIAVTPAPKRPTSWVGRWLRATRARFTWQGVVVAAAVLALLGGYWLLVASRDTGGPLTPGDGQIARSDVGSVGSEDDASQTIVAIAIPDELWSDGFLAFRERKQLEESLNGEEMEGVDAAAQWISGEEDDAELLLPFGAEAPVWIDTSADELASVWDSTDYELLPFDSGDPFDGVGMWGLGTLTNEELTELELSLGS